MSEKLVLVILFNPPKYKINTSLVVENAEGILLYMEQPVAPCHSPEHRPLAAPCHSPKH
jgi:hypothetical protein